MTWWPTRDAALARLDEFLPRAGRSYRTRRNEDRGPGQHRYVSGLSPYLRHRLLLDEEVLSAVLTQHSTEDAAKFIDEVFWRSYFKGWLEHHPDVWTSYVEDCAELHENLQQDPALRREYAAAIHGRTGIAPFDAWARELRSTGYLHNHARMWFASIWIFTLGLPWQLGARWFHYHLLDGDAAANTLSWRWVAGLHTRGKTYLARAGNIRRYAGSRFDTTAEASALNGLERLASSAPALKEDAAITAPRDPGWPPDAQSLRHGRVGLLLHDEDLHLRAPLIPDAVAVLAPERVRRRIASRPVARFGLGSARDTLARANAQFELQKPAMLLRSDHAVERWLRAADIDLLLMPYVPRGPSHARMTEVQGTAAALDIETHIFRRRLDRLTWPHAQRGFFGLRRQIPAILETLRQTRG